MRPFKYSLHRCALQGCEIMADFRLDDGRFICSKHAYMFGLATKVIAAHNAEEEARENRDVLEELEGDQLPPGDEVNGKPPRK